jgi:hypothetical protein
MVCTSTLLAQVVLLIVITYNTNIASSAPADPFDINEAYTNLMYAYTAYCNPVPLLSWTCFFCTYNETLTKGFQVYAFAHDTAKNVFGYVGYKNDTVVVSFRGTVSNSLIDWIEDLNFSHQDPYPNVTNAFVHDGFYKAYKALKPEVTIAVNALLSKGFATRLVVTGHSLGGALATLCAVDLAPTVNVPVILYTYGSPRVGNSYFVSYFDTLVFTSYRAVNQADIVPHLPMKSLDFSHVTTEVWWKTATNYIVCSATNGEDPNCSDSIVHPANITDHLDYLNTPLGLGGC